MYRLDELDNGLKIVTEPMAHMESVAIGMWICAGGRYQNKVNSGISHVLEHLHLVEGADVERVGVERGVEEGLRLGLAADLHVEHAEADGYSDA